MYENRSSKITQSHNTRPLRPYALPSRRCEECSSCHKMEILYHYQKCW